MELLHHLRGQILHEIDVGSRFFRGTHTGCAHERGECRERGTGDSAAPGLGCRTTHVYYSFAPRTSGSASPHRSNTSVSVTRTSANSPVRTSPLTNTSPSMSGACP